MPVWPCWCWAVFLLCWGGFGYAAQIEYLYINASEGTASGGHAALKLDDEVYHFQHVPPGLLRIKREDFAQFRQQYGERENRTIWLHHIEISDETKQRLREHFNRILLIEDEQFDRLDALSHDRYLLLALLQLATPDLSQSDEPPSLELKGSGLFFPAVWNPDTAKNPPRAINPSLERLANWIDAVYGNAFLAAKTSELRLALQALEPGAYDSQTIALAEDHFEPTPPSYAGRYVDGLSALAALQVLALKLPLADGVLLRPEGAEFRLDSGAKANLTDYRTKLEAQIIGLLRAQRPDWGFPLLLSMARLVALDESLASGRLAVLDLKGKPATDEAHDPDQARRVYEWSHSRWLAVKAELVGEPVDEWAYARLERAANLYHEYRQALRESRTPNVAGMSLSPSRPAKATLIQTKMSAAKLQAHLARLDIYRLAYETRLKDLYAYHLVGRNCASEIFRAIELAMQTGQRLPITEDSLKASLDNQLGGQVSEQSLAFIPFLSFRAVAENWRVVGSDELPSYRQRWMKQAKTQESPWLVEWRESNVLSSQLYHWHRGDAAFLLFSDDKLWLRPLAGGLNLAAGLAQGLAGLFTAPWDGGQTLWQGTKGALISLPELVFFNIRKGSFPSLYYFAENP